MNFILGLVFAVIVFVGFYSACEIYSFSELYFARDYYCPEKFRKKQKVTDMLSILHNIFVMAVSILCIMFLTEYFTGYEFNDYHTYNIYGIVITSVLGIIDVFTLEIISKKYELEETKNNIHKLWEKQKTFTKEHNDEVNLYRGCKEVTEVYKGYSKFLLIIMLIISLIIL